MKCVLIEHTEIKHTRNGNTVVKMYVLTIMINSCFMIPLCYRATQSAELDSEDDDSRLPPLFLLFLGFLFFVLLLRFFRRSAGFVGLGNGKGSAVISAPALKVL